MGLEKFRETKETDDCSRVNLDVILSSIRVRESAINIHDYPREILNPKHTDREN